ncbi:TIGR03013 family XrtA/PEP-CTERM system glycosyltransferase [Ectothiorhodospira lacustris]|uniref:TIGR03013 family XrtA/PEP-CTERM system glycosyltransferase n=1 Tax=Ectothiorhodospira lacustris TaxID=2899127 RepID=UPI001EE80A7E|nr:TIGR03013 family XrtA/PEP-CTERM system glycosyltransferase [Ectothiorhodospira lacustris]MCG5501102.1 TIGR03013 family PEP-CTERM/XrtA system glycosyltransferase [Ectothiorhodospira lacustris]MCG5510842.1 TIGR03013 family PEP-CTERM/XrtA system glycosyltransferase [Ectothiorhodospira lacustris]MCG5522612.1 TIGR03013 family PEP-CTERM/XrtA system glycosyltransferase [Ectothiorhodospira lacustris]
MATVVDSAEYEVQPQPGVRNTSHSGLSSATAGIKRPVRVRHGHINILGRDISTPVIFLASAEALVFGLALLAACFIKLPFPPPLPAVLDIIWSLQMLAFVVLGMVGMLSMGLYRRGFRGGANAVVLRILGAALLSVAMMSMLFYVFPDLYFGRGIMAIAMGLAIPGILVTRFGIFRLLAHDAFKRRVLVLGAGESAQLFNRLRRKSDQVGFILVGFVPRPGEKTKVASDSTLRLDTPLPEFVRSHHVDDLVIAYDDPRGGFPAEELMHCKMQGLHVLDIADFFEREAGLLKLDILRPSSMIFGRGFRQTLYQQYAKRALDVVTSLAMLAFVWPFMLICAVAVMIESKGQGSVVFRQVRTGQHGKPFTLFKFRSMIMDAEKDGVARWAQKSDPRVTRFGAFMRKTRLDELPQLINVLRGDMSFVGPRPERPEFVEQLGGKLPYYHHRHWVKPGLTGWAQIHYPYGASEKDAFEKLKYDLYYVKNQSMSLDLLTIVQTVEVVLWGRGSR